ncbi:MAG: glycoside hydrolase family 38 C-terminal domain-containing protein [Negativicutes bacterium]|jgi:alpha-mannosidase
MIRRARELHEKRIRRTLEQLEDKFYEPGIPLEATYCNFGDGIVAFADRLNGEYKPVQAGAAWGENFGKTWDHAWFQLKGVVPAEWQGKNVVALLHIGAEGCVYDNEGMPLQGITAYATWDPGFYRDRLELFERARGGEAVELWIEASVSLMFGVPIDSQLKNGLPAKLGYHKAVVNKLNLAIWRKDVWELQLDIKTLFDLSQALPELSVRRDRILHAINRAIDILEFDAETISRCREILRPLLEKRANESALTAWCVGHAHIDTAWLWPYEETIRKCARTFSTQITLSDKYPEFIFGASQAQHYAMTKQYYPKLYRRIKDKICDGKWEVQGAMWVEADCNVTGGESLVRQILHGKNYFMDEFSENVRNLWLPDVFGYAASLPQILKKSGVDYFVTQKISWNQFNKFPHHTFMWEGIDGTSILTHFPPEDTYNSVLNPAGLRRAEDNFQEKAVLDDFLTLFGIGDGGGGPTAEMIEIGRRQQNLEGAPKVKFGCAGELLDRINESVDELDHWKGELYLELHRGTLTTQAFNKKMNRKLELNLRELEILYSSIGVEHYPQLELDALWKETLMNQFHDIIPGSSVNRVYVDCRNDYKRLLEKCSELLERYVALVSDNAENCMTAINTLSSAYTREVVLPSTWRGHEVQLADGTIVPSTECATNVYVMPQIPGLSAVTLYRGERYEPAAKPQRAETTENLVLENELVRYEFATDGTIVYGYDKAADFAFIPRGMRGNVFNLYADHPVDWDAWDVDYYHEQQLRASACCVSMTKFINGSMAQGLQLNFELGNSKLQQFAMIFANSKRIEFGTFVDWNEKHKLLKVEFAVDVHTDQATYELQYGSLKRNTHKNTLWDFAKFEVCGHRYVDLSDKNYGVALLNDCKYGHKIFGNKIELSLLRAPNYPDPEADIGQHCFTYSFLPHSETLEQSAVLNEAAQLNQKAVVVKGAVSFVPAARIVDGEAIVEVIKKAEKSAATIVRIYEPYGKRTTVLLAVPELSVCCEVDMMEWNELKSLKNIDGVVKINLKPFEIFTLKIVK